MIRMRAARLVVWLVDLYARVRHRRLVKTFRHTLGYSPSIGWPRTYNEKYLWRKIFDHNPLFATFCDKLASKAYIAERFPDVAMLRPLWTGTSADDIPDDILSGGVIIKQNNASSRNIVIPGGVYDRVDIKRTISAWQAKPYGRRKGEWGYSRANPAIFVEPLLPSSTESPLIDCGVVCTNGTPVFMTISLNNKTDDWAFGFFRSNGKRAATHLTSRSSEKNQLKPDFQLPAEALTARAIAERLSDGIDHIRCDFMIADGQIYFCEMTPYSASGLMQHSDQELIGPATALWDLRKSWFLASTQRGWRGLYARSLRFLLDQG